MNTTPAKDHIKRQLDRFGYVYKERAQAFEVQLGFNLLATIDLSKEDRVLITERLQGWNILTGLIPTKDLGRAIRYTWILMAGIYILAVLLIPALDDKYFSLSGVVLLVLISMVALTTTLSGISFYLAKAESFRQAVISWVKD